MKKRLLLLATFSIALIIAFVILSPSVAGAASGGGPGGAPGQISGTVTSGSGGPMYDAFVTVITVDGSPIGSAQTDYSGNYTTSSIPAGSYKVEFEQGPFYNNYLSQYYNNKPDFSSADLVTVTAGSTTTGIDAVLQNTYACSKPDLRIGLGGPSLMGNYWASYADYLARNLTVDYGITNYGPSASNVTITQADGTNGVTAITPLPLNIGNLGYQFSNTVDVFLVYHLPAGIDSFASTISLTAQDICQHVYSYSSTNTILASTIRGVQGPVPLSLNKQLVYWQSYADYTAHQLAVDYTISNQSGADVYTVTITGSSATNGVTASSAFPIATGDLPTGSSLGFTIKYQIPDGTDSFVAGVTATARDCFLVSYSYP